MEYKEYLASIIVALKETVAEDSIRLYIKGFRPTKNDEKVLVKETNSKYFGKNTSVYLLGDTITITLPRTSDSVETVVRVMPSLNFENKVSVETVVKKLGNDVDAILNSNKYIKEIERRASGNYETVRSQLVLRPLNFNRHVNDLQDAVYEREGDIAIVLYQLVHDSESNLLTSKIRREEVEVWGKREDLETVFRDAMDNTMRLYPAVVLDKETQQEIDFLKSDINSADDISTAFGSILLSTTRGTNGAIAIFCNQVREKLHKLLGESFYAVFMNINDVMIVPKSNKSLARSYLANSKQSSDMGEMLSENIFISNKHGFAPVK